MNLPLKVILLFSLSLANAYSLLIANGTNGTSNQPCPDLFTLVGDQCLMFFTTGLENYAGARQLCQTVDGELATIYSARQFQYIVDHIKDSGLSGHDFWLDGTDEANEGHWVTSSGQAVPMGTPFWAAMPDWQQPDNAQGNEDCLHISAELHLHLNDIHCGSMMNFICQSYTDGPKKTPSTDGRSGCPPFYDEVGGLCLMFATFASETWQDAQAVCGDNSDLLAITDIEVLRAIYLYLHQQNIHDHTFWLGGSDIGHEGSWVYTTGEPVPMGTPFWGLNEKHQQEPLGGTNENCLMLQAAGSHYFRDFPCSAKLNPLCVLKE